MPHPALVPDAVAVVTGGASGIGLAAASRFAEAGLQVCIADLGAGAAGGGGGGAGGRGARRRRRGHGGRDRRRPGGRAGAAGGGGGERFGGTDVLMNNAGIQPGTGVFGPAEVWERILATNLRGVIHGTQAFVPGMIARGRPGLVINTGSKQGITTPPGNPAYNVSKAGVKVYTEALAHELRQTEGCRVSAHLLIPGFVFTGLTRGDRAEKPAAAWTPEQTVDFMLDEARGGGLLHPLPGQRRRRGRSTRSGSSGRPATSSRTDRRCRAGIRALPTPLPHTSGESNAPFRPASPRRGWRRGRRCGGAPPRLRPG